MSDDKSEISGTVGFDIPQMGMFEKSIIASVHVTVLESNPTTDGDYELEYTTGRGDSVPYKHLTRRASQAVSTSMA